MAKNSGKNKINDKVLNDVTYQIMKVLFEVTREKVEKEEYLPPFPSNNWSFRGERVVVFDASNMKQGQIPKNDLIYLLKMYQRDDIAVITKGVVDAKILKLFDFWVFLSQALGTKVHQKFVKLDMPTPKAQQGPKHKRGRGRPKKVLKTDDSNSDDIETMASYHESGVQYKLTGIEYAEFLKLQLEYHDNVSKGVASPNGSMVTIQVFEEGNEEAVSVQIDLSKSTLYMKDLLLEEVYPTWDRMIQENIKVPTVPFKEYCFMENVSFVLLHVVNHTHLIIGLLLTIPPCCSDSKIWSPQFNGLCLSDTRRWLSISP